LGWWLVAIPLLLAVRAIRSFGALRTVERLQPLAELRADDMPMPLATSTVPLLAWIVVPPGARSLAHHHRNA
jgi:hypothetical protein